MHPGGGHLGGGNGHNVILEKALEKVWEKIDQWRNSPNPQAKFLTCGGGKFCAFFCHT